MTFRLGNQGRMVLTGSDGIATASFFVLAQPGVYALSVTYEGDTTYTYASTSSSFEVVAGNSFIELVPELQEIIPSGSPVFTATLTNSAGLPLTLKPVALTLDSGGTVLYTSMATTDYAGQARCSYQFKPQGNTLSPFGSVSRLRKI